MEFHMQVADILANFLDNKFSILGIRFGVSALIEFIPGIGDILDLVLSLYLIWIATKMELSQDVIAKMIANIIFSFIIGLVPILGDASYIFYRPNYRNLKLLKQYSGRKAIEGKIIE